MESSSTKEPVKRSTKQSTRPSQKRRDNPQTSKHTKQESGPRLQGKITSLKENFGFITCTTSSSDVFFHFDDVVSPPLDLQVGSEVLFSMRVVSTQKDARKKDKASRVSQVPKGTIVWDSIEEKNLMAVVEKGLPQGLLRALPLPLPSPLPLILPLPPSASSLPFYNSPNRPRHPKLQSGDLVEYSRAVDLRSQQTHGVHIRVVKSFEARQKEHMATLLEGVEEEFGVIVAKGKVVCGDREELVHFVDKTSPHAKDAKWTRSRPLQVGQGVGMKVVELGGQLVAWEVRGVKRGSVSLYERVGDLVQAVLSPQLDFEVDIDQETKSVKYLSQGGHKSAQHKEAQVGDLCEFRVVRWGSGTQLSALKVVIKTPHEELLFESNLHRCLCPELAPTRMVGVVTGTNRRRTIMGDDKKTVSYSLEDCLSGVRVLDHVSYSLVKGKATRVYVLPSNRTCVVANVQGSVLKDELVSFEFPNVGSFNQAYLKHMYSKLVPVHSVAQGGFEVEQGYSTTLPLDVTKLDSGEISGHAKKEKKPVPVGKTISFDLCFEEGAFVAVYQGEKKHVGIVASTKDKNFGFIQSTRNEDRLFFHRKEAGVFPSAGQVVEYRVAEQGAEGLSAVQVDVVLGVDAKEVVAGLSKQIPGERLEGVVIKAASRLQGKNDHVLARQVSEMFHGKHMGQVFVPTRMSLQDFVLARKAASTKPRKSRKKEKPSFKDWRQDTGLIRALKRFKDSQQADFVELASEEAKDVQRVSESMDLVSFNKVVFRNVGLRDVYMGMVDKVGCRVRCVGGEGVVKGIRPGLVYEIELTFGVLFTKECELVYKKGDLVECMYGRGRVVQVREEEYCVELIGWSLANDLHPMAYLRGEVLSPSSMNSSSPNTKNPLTSLQNPSNPLLEGTTYFFGLADVSEGQFPMVDDVVSFNLRSTHKQTFIRGLSVCLSEFHASSPSTGTVEGRKLRGGWVRPSQIHASTDNVDEAFKPGGGGRDGSLEFSASEVVHGVVLEEGDTVEYYLYKDPISRVFSATRLRFLSRPKKEASKAMDPNAKAPRLNANLLTKLKGEGADSFVFKQASQEGEVGFTHDLWRGSRREPMVFNAAVPEFVMPM